MWSRITEALEWCGSIHGRQKKQGSFIRINYTVSQKKQNTILLCITSPNVNRFSKFFYWQTQWQICNKRTHTHNRLTAFVRDNLGKPQKKHSPTHTQPDHRTSFIIFLHLQRFMASSLFMLRAWQSSQTTSLQVLFGLPLGLGPWTSCSIHFLTQSSSSFRSTCPYQHSLFCCKTNAMSCIPSLSLSAPYLGVCLLA